MQIRRIVSKKEERIQRVAAYARVSTLSEEQADSFETQQDYYKTLIGSNPKWQFVKVYSDQGVSGTDTGKRKGFTRMLADAKNGEIDIILVKSISRFARNSVDAQRYVRDLKNCGVEVRFDREGLSTFDPSSEMIFHMLALMAQEESRSISENVKWANARRAEQGVRHLGNNRIFGYDERNGILAPNADAWKVRLIFESYAKGTGIAEICHCLEVAGIRTMRGKERFQPETIKRMLKNEVYAGDLRIQKEAPRDYLTKKPDYNRAYDSFFIRNDHPEIVGRRLWKQAQNRLKKDAEAVKNKTFQNTGRRHYLTGKVICGRCGRPFFRQMDHGLAYWKCTGKRAHTCDLRLYLREKSILDAIEESLALPATQECVRTHVERVVVYGKEEMEVVGKQ